MNENAGPPGKIGVRRISYGSDQKSLPPESVAMPNEKPALLTKDFISVLRAKSSDYILHHPACVERHPDPAVAEVSPEGVPGCLRSYDPHVFRFSDREDGCIQRRVEGVGDDRHPVPCTALFVCERGDVGLRSGYLKLRQHVEDIHSRGASRGSTVLNVGPDSPISRRRFLRVERGLRWRWSVTEFPVH